MILDQQLLFSNNQTLTGSTTGTASSVINLVNPEDLGIGSGQAQPVIVVQFPAAVTDASSGFTMNIQFQGSTDSSNWTTYIETGALSTASFTTGSTFRFAWPRRLPGNALPQYVRLNYLGAGSTNTTISTGTVFASVTLDDLGWSLDQYPSNFVVAP